MKVRIMHTVRYEDIPNILNELINKCRSELKRSSEFKFNISNLAKTTEEIREIQETLDLVTSQLEDCLNLYQGYLGYQQQEEQEEELVSTTEVQVLSETEEQDE